MRPTVFRVLAPLSRIAWYRRVDWMPILAFLSLVGITVFVILCAAKAVR